MKEIKFRAWDYTEKKMTKCFSIWEIKGFTCADFRDLEIMQFTGLKDKNGKEIYEGDIVKVKGRMAVVRFNHGMFCYKNFGKKVNKRLGKKELIEEIEVIGNKFENGDLINGSS